MKKAILCLLPFSLLFSGCKKRDSDGYFWLLNGQSYKVMSVSRVNTDYLQAVNNPNDTAKNILRFHFSKIPVTSGNYKIAGNIPFSVPSSQVSIEVISNGLLTYYSTPNNTSKANILVSSGQIFVSLPEIWLYKGSSRDSVLISAEINGF